MIVRFIRGLPHRGECGQKSSGRQGTQAGADATIEDAEGFDEGGMLSESASPEALAMGGELAEVVESALNALPDELEAALMLRSLTG